MAFDQRKVRANERIRSTQIRLVGPAGEQIGITTTQDGMTRAQEAGLDLVEVASTTNPPVCRIMDLGKHLYSLDKKEKESRKKQKVIGVKEVKMTTKIADHDYQTKLRNARRFLERGDKVKLTVFFRGREIVYAAKGNLLINRFVQDISDVAMIERHNGLEGKSIQVYLTKITSAPKKKEPVAGPSAKAAPTKTE